MFQFIDKVYLPTIHCKRPGGGATLKTTGDLLYVFENLVVGVPRIRQLRVTPDSCKIPSDFKEIFNQCYDYFSKKSESKEPFGPKAGTAWTYSEDLAQEYNGKVSSYTSGGFYYSFARDCFEIKKFLGELKDKKWIDEGTRAVFLDFSVYSPNVNLFCSSKLVAELPPSGGVVTQATFKTLKLIRYVTIWEHVILGVEMFIVVFICYFMFQELRKIRLFKWAYICMFWNLIDLSIVILSLVVVVVAIWRFLSVRSKLPAIVEIMKNEGHGNLDELATVQETFDILLGCLVALVWLKLLKYLMLCRTIYHILTTISRVVTELIGLIVILFMLLLSFALLAHLLYGSQVEEFGSLGSSITSLALLIIGALDYEKILNIRPVIGAIFFILFIFLYVLVFVSLLIAILVNGFATMRFEIMEDRHRIFMKQMFFKFLHWILSAFNLKQAAENVKKQAMSNKDKEDYRIIIEILRRSGFRGKEITAFLEKHNVVEGEPITDKKMQEVYSEIDTKGQLYMEAIEHEQIMSQVDVLKIRMNYIDKMTEEMAGKVELLLDKILHR